MSLAQALWSVTGSPLSPMILQLRFSNSGLRPARYPSSVVQTGVKSFGCENRIAQPLPIHLWKLIGPSVVWASKSGATSPSLSDMGVSFRHAALPRACDGAENPGVHRMPYCRSGFQGTLRPADPPVKCTSEPGRAPYRCGGARGAHRIGAHRRA